ncbi:hypothetical protein A0H76_1220 [Hepatospora eriocheir]|uniref:Uncharacterized protein n=1 Tax=Hepatospora eriocheir TaxID=1081669 RepID=A0A1X0QHG1_9MICR|nr:hypothetical protein A0H76_1220 [Hepatospora eriocheir]
MLKKIKIGYNEPVNTIITIFMKAATMLMSKIFSFDFPFNIVLIIIYNICLIYKALNYDENDLSEITNTANSSTLLKRIKVFEITYKYVYYVTINYCEEFSLYEII